jgi:hypothetical protein
VPGERIASHLSLSELVGIDCRGLLGADVFGCFDQIIDLPGGRLTLDSGELEHPGHAIELGEFMGIPIIPVTVAGKTFRLFFDTGAQVSYLQDDALETFPSAGVMRDFYPGFGEFETETHNVPISLGPLVDLSCACSFALPTRTSAFPGDWNAALRPTAGLARHVLGLRIPGVFGLDAGWMP